MNKLLLFIFSILIISCSNENKATKNGLRGNVKFVTEYDINVAYDSLNKASIDTLTIIKRTYNNKNQIIKRNQTYTFQEESMTILYEYNSFDELDKERVKMSFTNDTLDVNYIYKGLILEKTIAKSFLDSIEFNHIGLYYYNKNKKLIKNTFSQLAINLKENDTLTNSLQTEYFNEKEILTESTYKYIRKPTENCRYEYFYKSDDLVKTLEYDQNDSLISTMKFEYKKDKIGNDIKRETFTNNVLIAIKRWKITYDNTI